ncbi:MAG: hypothetical protein NDJ18_07345 [candidate division Zixibacteria bacterium]|nr:hypothetical protein [candidate division Zixibacteria bacterium]
MIVLCQVLSLVVVLFILTGMGPAVAGPDKISYQGKATDAAGYSLPDGDYSFTFRLFEYPTEGEERWLEIATVHTDGGLFTHLLGSINPIPVWLFSTYDSLFLEIAIGPQRLSPRTPLTSAGYALSVNSIDNALGGSIYGGIYIRNQTTSELGARIIVGNQGTGEVHLQKADGTFGISLFGDNVGSSAVQLPPGAIQATEILDEPGVGSDNNTSIHLTGSPQFLAGRTMTAPVDGYVLVVATAHFTIQHANGVQSSCMLGVSDNISSFVTSTIARLTLPASLPTGLYEFPLASHALFPVSAGSQPYYALGTKSGATSVTVYDVQLTECFFPTAYTTVSPLVPPLGSTERSSALFDPAAERLESQAFDNARLQAELDQIKAELEGVKQHLTNVKSGDDPKR